MTAFQFIPTEVQKAVDALTLDPSHITVKKALTTLRVVAVDAS